MSKSMGRLEKIICTWQAKLWLLIGQKKRAKSIFEYMLQKSPDDIYALNSLGYSALVLGDHLAAYQHFFRVSQLEPTKSNSHFNVAFASSELGQLYEAEAQFRAALKIENNMDRAWYGLGLVLVRQGRTAEALEAFKINTKLQPMSPYGWYQLGRVHKELGDMDAAEKVVHKLNGFEPKVAAQLARDLGV